MDFICVNQHKTSAFKKFEDWAEVFATSLKEIGQAVIVLTPATNPTVPTRSWCCFEMTQMVDVKIPYSICISPDDHGQLIKDIRANKIDFNVWQTLFSRIDVEHSKASKLEDQTAILNLMAKIGVIKVNDVVLKALKSKYLEIVVEAQTGAVEQELASVLYSRSCLHQALGEFNEAITVCKEALKVREAIPNDNEETAAVLNALSQMLSDTGRSYEAGQREEDSRAYYEEIYGLDHPFIRYKVAIVQIQTGQARSIPHSQYYEETR
jgi:tetratricopeptide (TPR) repeat protein